MKRKLTPKERVLRKFPEAFCCFMRDYGSDGEWVVWDRRGLFGCPCKILAFATTTRQAWAAAARGLK